jgi:predicted RNA binding protein YcfA (HicA-like mRNA interferase family)
MSRWPSTRASKVLAALLRLGWREVRRVGSHRRLTRDRWPPFTFAFHDNEELGPSMLARVARHTGLRPEDL